MPSLMIDAASRVAVVVPSPARSFVFSKWRQWLSAWPLLRGEMHFSKEDKNSAQR